MAAANPPRARYADWTAPLYRRRQVPMDDLVGCEGLARLPGVLAPAELARGLSALDSASRSIDGTDACRRRRKKNAFLRSSTRAAERDVK
jgi:hypothetical protein